MNGIDLSACFGRDSDPLPSDVAPSFASFAKVMVDLADSRPQKLAFELAEGLDITDIGWNICKCFTV